jgi:N-acetylglucosaminyldiphosphoundecaprenol N-acetyl-beta-D-mannosaminyltransferase
MIDGWQAGRGGWILTVNTDILRRLKRSPSYADLVSSATLRVADGMPLVWASFFSGDRFPERVAGSDLVNELANAAAFEGRGIYLIGGSGQSAFKTASLLAGRHPSAQIVGVDVPPLGFESQPGYIRDLQDRLLAAAPDLVFVALGSPLQDRLIARLQPTLPVTWFIGVGIAFSYEAGEVRRAPALMRAVGLEWAYRLVQEPRRLARRYLIDDLPFAVALIVGSFWRRINVLKGQNP